MTLTVVDRNLAAIQGIYEAFGRGDLDGMLAHIAEDVDWDFAYPADHAIPWLQHGCGHAQVVHFMTEFATHLQPVGFEIREIISGGNTVVVIFDIECVVKANGKTLKEVEETHIWHFNDEGKVIRFRHDADTLQQYLALQ